MPTATPNLTNLRNDTISEIELLISAVLQLLGLLIYPWSTSAADYVPTLNTLISTIVGLLESIPGNIAVLFTDNFQSTHNLLYALVTTVLGPFGAAAAKDYTELLEALFSAYNANLVAGKTTDPTQVDALATSALEEASTLGVGARVVTSIFELFLPKQLNFMNWLGPTLAQFSGYDEIIGLWREPLLRAAIGNLSEYNANQQFLTKAPEDPLARQMYARRLISETQLSKLINWGGMMTEFQAPTLATSYRPIQPRMFATLLQDVPFPTAQVQDALQFAGTRDSDISTLLPVLEQASIKNVRQQYLSSIVRSAELGSISEAELQSDLTGLGFSPDAVNYVLLTVAQHQLDNLLTLYRREITTLYSTNQLSDAQYLPALEAAGMDPDLANGYYGIDSAKLHGKELAASTRAANRLAQQATSLALKTAKSEYLAGSIDDVAMAAAVTASGLDLNLVPLTIALYNAELSAKRINTFGVLLGRNASVLLREKVAALGVQVHAALITPAQGLAALEGLGIPTANSRALIADFAGSRTPAADVGTLQPV